MSNGPMTVTIGQKIYLAGFQSFVPAVVVVSEHVVTHRLSDGTVILNNDHFTPLELDARFQPTAVEAVQAFKDELITESIQGLTELAQSLQGYTKQLKTANEIDPAKVAMSVVKMGDATK